MKKLLKVIAWILVIGLVIGYVTDKDKMKEKINNIFFGKNSSEEETEVGDDLKSPNNVGVFIKEGLIMDEPSLAFKEEKNGVPSIQYTYTLSDTADVNERNLVLIVATQESFDTVNEKNVTYDYWVDLLEEKNMPYSIIDESFMNNGKRSFFFDCDEFKWLETETGWSYNKKVNVPLVGWIAEKREDASGEIYYDYAEFDEDGDYRTSARTLAQIACDMLNRNAAGEKDYTQIETDLLKIMNASVDYAYGEKNPSIISDSLYHFSPSKTEITIGINEKIAIKGTISLDADMPLFYKSADETIARVDAKGNVYGVTRGTTVIIVYLNGEKNSINVTVE